MDPDGTDRLLVVSVPLGSLGEGLSVAPSWAPDGSVFVYAARTDYHSTSQDLYVVSGDGSGRTLLTGTGDTTEYGPVLSPDGARIVFALTRLGVRRFAVRPVHHEDRRLGRPAPHRHAETERIHEIVEIDPGLTGSDTYVQVSVRARSALPPTSFEICSSG